MVKPRGTYTWWRWPPAAAGASSLAWDLTVLRDPGPTTYFWAQSWCFQGGDVGYLGLQAHDRRDDGGQGRLAVFSVWSAIGCGDNPGCHPGVEGSPFWTCRLPYRWQPGRAYRLRVARARTGWWHASVTDLAGGTETTVGGIRVPASWGGLDLAGRGSAMWVEFYAANAPGGVAACELVPHTRVRFGAPAAGVGRAAGGGAVAPAGHANRLGEGDCANSRVGDDGDGVLHEMGIPPSAQLRPLVKGASPSVSGRKRREAAASAKTRAVVLGLMSSFSATDLVLIGFPSPDDVPRPILAGARGRSQGGDMRLTKLGHSCLLVEEGGARLLLDPGTLSVGFEELEGLTAVLFTHQHADHLDRERLRGLLDRNPRARVVSDEGSAEPLGQAGVEVEVVHDGEELDLGGVGVRVAGRDHAVIHPDIPVVPNVGYLVGGRLFHPGDAFTPPGQPVEVLAVPAGAPWLKVSEPIDYLRAVRPRVAVPVHDQVLSAAGRTMHYRQLEQLGAKDGTTLRSLDDGTPAEL